MKAFYRIESSVITNYSKNFLEKRRNMVCIYQSSELFVHLFQVQKKLQLFVYEENYNEIYDKSCFIQDETNSPTTDQ